MKKRYTKLKIALIALLLLAAAFNIYLYQFYSKLPTLSEQDGATVKQMRELSGNYFKSRLTDEKEIALYEEMQTALLYRDDDYILTFHDQETIHKIALFVCLDSPFLTVSDSYYTVEMSGESSIKEKWINPTPLPFDLKTSDYYNKMRKALAAAEQVIEEMPQTADEYEKARYLHDYLITHVRYANDTEDLDADTVYGALVNGRARCEGYSGAYGLLLKLAGMENFEVLYLAQDTQEEAGHIWNMVQVNGNYYHVDATNDAFNEKDPYPANYVSYDYFLRTTQDYTKNFPINALLVHLLPPADSVQDSFFNRNGLLFSSYERESVGKKAGQFLAAQKKEGVCGVSLRFERKEDYEKAVNPDERRYLLGIISEYDDYDAESFHCFLNQSQQILRIYPIKK